MRIRRKTKNCLNCGLTLNEIYHYCPQCGQENNDQNVSFGTLIKEFVINYFSFDTKFVRSIVPFVSKPGFLTLRFNEGKRASYVNPLRLYLIISVVFFFFSTLWVKDTFDPITNQEELDKAIQNDSTVGDLDSVNYDQWKVLGDILSDGSLSDEQAFDSLQSYADLDFEIDSFVGKVAFRQMRKVAKNDLDVFVTYVMQNAPIMMFLLLPIFALLLKLLYITKKQLYVNHLIHGIHLHAFVFLLLSFTLLMSLMIEFGEEMIGWIQFLLQILIFLHLYFSFRRVYQQGRIITCFKILILVSFYTVAFILFGLSETVISFFIF